jgi:U3 small nucleolar ribonucleoprotein protein IMP4
MAMRRTSRLRREYLYKKSLEGKEREEFDKKEAVRSALATGTPLPGDLREDAVKLKRAADLDDERTAQLRSHVDDEYASAAYRDPRVCVITSRDPSSRLRVFASEVRLLFPGAVRINRGATTMTEVVKAAAAADFTDIIAVHETRGEPDALIVSHLPFGPTVHFTLSGAVLRHDIEGAAPVSEAAPHLIFQGFTTPLGKRVQTVLTALFPPPRVDSQRVLTFSNEADFISFRHHTYKKTAGVSSASAVTLAEVGPRFQMRPYLIKLGTLDQDGAEVEWVLKAFTNTSRKRSAL